MAVTTALLQTLVAHPSVDDPGSRKLPATGGPVLVGMGPAVERIRSARSANDVLDVEDASERNIAMYIGLGAVVLIIVLFVLLRGGL